jgi:Holliday junction resolvasome RuvABC endonuclease subunit
VRVLGVDPGIASCGWAVVETDRLHRSAASGTIRTRAAIIKPASRIRAAADLGGRMEVVINALDAAARGVELVAVEAWGYQGPRSHGPNGANISRLIGQIEGIAARLGIPCKVIETMQVKSALGAKDKAGVQVALKARGWRAGTGHEFDAIAVAVVAADLVRVEGRRRA